MTGERLDPRIHLLVGLGMGLIVMLPELRSRRAIAAVGLLGLAGVALDGDIFLWSRIGVRFGESALLFFGLPAALLALFCWVERGSARTLGRTFSIGLLAVLPAQVFLDAAKGHEIALYYPLSTASYGLAFAEPGVAYSGLNGAFALIVMMTAVAAFVNLMIVADCRGIAFPGIGRNPDRGTISAQTLPASLPRHPTQAIPVARSSYRMPVAMRSSMARSRDAALRVARSRGHAFPRSASPSRKPGVALA